jgi:hypothetical protein
MTFVFTTYDVDCFPTTVLSIYFGFSLCDFGFSSSSEILDVSVFIYLRRDMNVPLLIIWCRFYLNSRYVYSYGRM